MKTSRSLHGGVTPGGFKNLTVSLSTQEQNNQPVKNLSQGKKWEVEKGEKEEKEEKEKKRKNQNGFMKKLPLISHKIVLILSQAWDQPADRGEGNSILGLRVRL